MPTELTRDHLVFMNIGDRYWDALLDNLTESQLSTRLKIDGDLRLRDYINNLDVALRKGEGLFLWGDNGHGKSYIAAALCKRVWGSLRVASYCITASELKDSWIEDLPAHPGSEETISQRASRIRFLVIDDVGKEHRAKTSDFAENKIGHLLRTRVRERKTTCLTLNFNPKEFGEVYGKSTSALMKECMYPVRVHGQDMRNKKAAEMGSAFK